MSVYKPKKSPYYTIDFVIRGRRVLLSTGQTSKSAAKKIELELRVREAQGTLEEDAGDLTLKQGAGRWFREKVVGTASEKDVARRLLTLLDCVGQNVKLREITGSVVANAILKRRSRLYRGHVIAGATMNRDIIAPLRAILRRAKRTWQAKNMPEIEWRDHLSEEKTHTREYTDREETEWLRACPSEVERLALRLLLRYGMRFGELWFHPSDVDAIGARLTIRRRKRNEWSTLVIPLAAHDARDLGRLAADALARAHRDLWGLRYYQMHYRLRTAAEKAGVTPGRIIHGTRHHAATKITRSSGNLAITKRLLGHASIMSTMRYAHANEDDVRRALDGMPKIGDKSRNSPGLIRRRVRKSDGSQGET